MARNAAKFLSANLRYPNGQPVQCVIADSCIGGVAEAAACAEKFRARRRRRVAHRHALLVLRQRDDGHGPADAEGGLGFQRHGTARARFIWPPCWPATTEGPARLRHLRPRRAGRRRYRASRSMCRRSCCASPGPASPWPSCAAKAICRWAAFRWASPVRSWTNRSSRSYLGMRVECVDMTEFVRRIEEKIYDEREFNRAYAWTRRQLQGRQGLEPRRNAATPGARIGNGRWS